MAGTRFVWGLNKNRISIKTHRMSFEYATRIFEGDVVTFPDTRRACKEERSKSIEMAGGVVVLAVIWTVRQGNCRVMSARRASRKERRQYAEEIRQAADHG